MLVISLINNKSFKSILNCATKFLDKLNFIVTDDGLKFSMIDDSHISFFTAKFDKEYFDTYDCGDIDTFTIPSTELGKALKRGKDGEKLEIIVDDDYFIISFIKDNKDKKVFKINLIDESYDSPTPPEIDYPVSTSIMFKDFKEALKDVEVNSDVVEIIIANGRILFSSDDDEGKSQTSIHILEDIGESFSSCFSIPKIKDVFNLDFDDVLIKIDNDTPLLLGFEDTYEESRIEYLLAPRIKED